MKLIKLTKSSNSSLYKSAQILYYRYIRTDLFLSNPKGEDEAMKVAIYCRLSEEDKNKLSKEDDSESIQNGKFTTFIAMTITRVQTETDLRLINC